MYIKSIVVSLHQKQKRKDMGSQKFKNSSLKHNKCKESIINDTRNKLNKMYEELAIKYNMTIKEVKIELNK